MTMPYAPENSYNLGADWTFAEFGTSALSLILNYRWEDRTYFSAPAGPAIPGRGHRAAAVQRGGRPGQGHQGSEERSERAVVGRGQPPAHRRVEDVGEEGARREAGAADERAPHLAVACQEGTKP